jgi:hypothetical protein
MPIYTMLQGQAFEPEHCRVMGIAFEGVLQELGLKDRNDPLCTMIASKIIELAKEGMHEPSRLHELALRAIQD